MGRLPANPSINYPITKFPNYPMLGLYIHVPFCSAICNYCNFNRGLFDADLKNRYVAALIQEIERAALIQEIERPTPAPKALRRGRAEARSQNGASQGDVEAAR